MTIVDFELSFQFPINREGASPETASVVVAVASGVAEAVSVGAADSLDVGDAVELSSFLFPPEITIAPRATTPIRTAKRTFEEEPWRGAAEGFAEGVGAALAAGAGVVEMFARALPVVGTGGTTKFVVADFLTADFLTAFLVTVFLRATAFLATAFLAVVFFAATFLAELFLAAVFLAGDFLATDFFAAFFTVFLGAAFFAADFFFTATIYLLELTDAIKLTMLNGGI
jgi:hypothetical protein